MILCHENFEEEGLNGKNGYSIAVCNQLFTDYYREN
jgi:hypothetical protein